MSDVSQAVSERLQRPSNVVSLASVRPSGESGVECERLAAEFAAVMQRRKVCAPADLKPPVVDDPVVEQAVTDLMSAAELHDLPARMARAAQHPGEDVRDEAETTTHRSVANALAWLARAQADRRRDTTKLVASWTLTILVGGGMMLAVAIALFGLPADLAELQSTAARVLRI